jgi:crossover junction endodeoxyribonuclease RuvC
MKIAMWNDMKRKSIFGPLSCGPSIAYKYAAKPIESRLGGDKRVINIMPKGDNATSQSFLSCRPFLSNALSQNSLSCRTSFPLVAHDIIVQAEGDKSTIPECNSDTAHNKATPRAAFRPYVMGIDPGISGAISILDISLEFPRLVTVFDMPTVEISVKGKKRKRIDVLSLAFKVDAYAQLIRIAMVEKVGQVGTNADPFSSFVFGHAAGVIDGVLSTCLIPTHKVLPAVWKLSFGLSSDKNLSIEKAKHFLPESEQYLKFKKHDGRAEAILLGWYAYKNLRKA